MLWNSILSKSRNTWEKNYQGNSNTCHKAIESLHSWSTVLIIKDDRYLYVKSALQY